MIRVYYYKRLKYHIYNYILYDYISKYNIIYDFNLITISLKDTIATPKMKIRKKILKEDKNKIVTPLRYASQYYF
jgi:hypothetical protein